MVSIVMKIPKLFRHLTGKGCSAADFDPVYARTDRDAWRYAENPFEMKRFDLIVRALRGLAVDKALEVGCAEGHLTRRLAGHVNELVACDIVETAIDRAKHHCRRLKNVRFLNIDVRSDWPEERFDLLIYSDVLYYFSKSEVKRVIQDSAQHVRAGGYLLFANEWHEHYRWKTPPAFVMEQLCGSPFWQLVFRRHHRSVSASRSLTVGLFRRRPVS